MPHPTLTIRRLAPNLRADFLRFFEGSAFADSPKWKSCYCQFLYVDHSKVTWSARTSDENRAPACERIACGRMQGLLAYLDGEVVGWCNAAPRTLLDSFADEPEPEPEPEPDPEPDPDPDPDPDGDRLSQITCFAVARSHRRTGVARALLEAACDMLREPGLAWVEANPSRNARTDAENHFGPLSLYLSAGFTLAREPDDGLSVVRRGLYYLTAPPVTPISALE